ncbi:hypothetical protein AB5N19_06518 [Seiridium cardinale]
MSTTTTSTSAAATCGSTLYDIPVQDAACALPYGGNHTDIMSACCKSANVVSYYENCGLYCLAEGQSVSDLTDCLHDNGASWTDVFCRGNTSATATGSDSSLPTSAGASIVATASDASKTGDSTASGTSSSSTSSSTGNAASRSQSSNGITTLGLTIGALLFSATTLGAFAL